MSELCQEFYRLGWMTGQSIPTDNCSMCSMLTIFYIPYLGTGGAISIKTEEGVLITPSGVLKESVTPEDIFTLDDDGEIIKSPIRGLKYSSCFPNFRHIYNLRFLKIAHTYL